MVKSNNMKIEINQTTLIDQVEDSLLTYFKKNDLRCGDSIPNENNLAAELGVARSVVREALSRLKMMGLIILIGNRIPTSQIILFKVGK